MVQAKPATRETETIVNDNFELVSAVIPTDVDPAMYSEQFPLRLPFVDGWHLQSGPGAR